MYGNYTFEPSHVHVYTKDRTHMRAMVMNSGYAVEIDVLACTSGVDMHWLASCKAC